MKKLVISVLLATLFILSSGVAGAEEKRKGIERLDPAKMRESERSLGRGRRSGQQRDRHNRRERSVRLRDRLQKIDEGIKTRQNEQTKLIEELVSIKNLAIKEDAKKTAKRIEALIEAKNAEYTDQTKKLKKSRERYGEMLVPAGLKLAERPKPPEAVAAETKQEEKEEAKEDKVRWWQFWK